MEYKTKEGRPISDAMWDEMAKEYEDGTWEGHGEVTMGRPKLFNEEMETVSFRIPHSRIVAIEATAAHEGISKSEFFRRAIDNELIAEAQAL